MGMQTDCIYGFGFRVFASDKALADFIKNHEATVKSLEGGTDILDYVNDCISNNKPLDSIKEMFYDYENNFTGDSGLYGIIADVMHKETAIRFEYRRTPDVDCCEDDAIILPIAMPWQFNETEQKLTEESLEKICKKYMSELDERLVFDSIRLEYFG